jgi:hypothetical protein
MGLASEVSDRGEKVVWQSGRRRVCTMSQQVKGVISRAKGAPVEVVTIVVPDPGPGEAVVKVQASTTSSRSCSATRRPASWSPSAPA